MYMSVWACMTWWKELLRANNKAAAPRKQVSNKTHSHITLIRESVTSSHSRETRSHHKNRSREEKKLTSPQIAFKYRHTEPQRVRKKPLASQNFFPPHSAPQFWTLAFSRHFDKNNIVWIYVEWRSAELFLYVQCGVEGGEGIKENGDGAFQRAYFRMWSKFSS